MQTIYRISDGGYKKLKLADKKICLESYLKAFPNVPLIIICDNCHPETIQMVKEHTQCEIIETSLGNSGSFRKALEIALDYNDTVYLPEDDYVYNILSNKDLEQVVNEGIKIADYVTLYDHTDKYGKIYNFGEVSKVMRTSSTHWKATISTTMTFAAMVETLKIDKKVWLKYTNENTPKDHECFCELNRLVVSSIPGLSYHIDTTDECEDWVFEILSNEYKDQLGPLFPEFNYPETLARQLMIMRSLIYIMDQQITCK